MKEFAKRLGIVVANILTVIMTLTITTFVIVAIFKYPLLTEILKWIIGIPFAIVILISIVIFIHWLFIEPFKKAEKE